MGNHIKEKQEFVTFELIQDALGIKDPHLFALYLKEIFHDLANSVNHDKKKFITRMVFYDYIRLPIFIAEKVFKSFSKLSVQGLCEEEFVDNLFKLYMGSFEETIAIIFKILDFDRDGIIKKEDVKLFLSYLPIYDADEEVGLGVKQEKSDKNKNDLVSKIFGAQMKSLEEIDQILTQVFSKFEDKMNLEQFTQIITEKNSIIFLQILCFLYDQMPFSSDNIKEFRSKYDLMNEKDIHSLSPEYKRRNKKSNTIRIKTPNQNTLLSPAGTFLKKFKVRKFSLNDDEPHINEFLATEPNPQQNNVFMKMGSKSISPDKKKNNLIFNKIEMKKNNDPYNINIDILRLNNENYIDRKNKFMNGANINIKDLVKNSKQGFTSPSKYLQDKGYMNHMALNNTNYNNYENQLNVIRESSEEFNENKNNDKIEDKSKIKITYQNWVYKVTESGKLRKFLIVLINQDIYYYKVDDNNKKTFVGLHNLSGCFVQEYNEPVILHGKTFYSFEIICNYKSRIRKYYTTEKTINKEFVYNIKKAIGFVKLSDLYEMKEVIGKGKFGVVNLAIHKKTGQQVAIKILTKENIKTLEDKELVRIEIGVLKLCHHPNIVRLLDHFENNDFIYIVMEYIEGGTLGQYFKLKKFNFSERQASNIMSQIASGVKYLQQYGIVHRDLKPNNIMITQQNDFGVIKIMDFGLSRIVSPNEKLIDGYGTLSFVSPEVLLRTPYNKEVDIWSLGVILFYMLSGKLPFRGKTEQEVAEKIVYGELVFDEYDWELKSPKVQDLIKCCLEKSADKRITIDEFINHPWFKKNMKQKLSM